MSPIDSHIHIPITLTLIFFLAVLGVFNILECKFENQNYICHLLNHIAKVK